MENGGCLYRPLAFIARPFHATHATLTPSSLAPVPSIPYGAKWLGSGAVGKGLQNSTKSMERVGLS